MNLSANCCVLSALVGLSLICTYIEAQNFDKGIIIII